MNTNYYQEHWNDMIHDYSKTSIEWLKAEFYWRVMCFLDKHQPDELMREEFRLNCERIYEEIPGLATVIPYYDLYNSNDMQDILQDRNDLYPNELN